MVEFEDNSILAQMGWPDMKLPIHYAICYPERKKSPARQMDFSRLSSISFSPPDVETFRLLPLAISAGKRGATAPVVLNAANEAAVELFLKGRISFLDIERIVEKCLNAHTIIPTPSIGDIIETDRQIKEEIMYDNAISAIIVFLLLILVWSSAFICKAADIKVLEFLQSGWGPQYLKTARRNGLFYSGFAYRRFLQNGGRRRDIG